MGINDLLEQLFRQRGFVPPQGPQPATISRKERRRLQRVIDRVSERDRSWFAHHPGEEHYLRPLIPGEHPSTGGDALLGWMLVTQIEPGIRVRQDWGMELQLSEDEPATVTFLATGQVLDRVLVDWGFRDRYALIVWQP